MAKIKVLENVVFVTSEVKAKDLEKVKNLKAAALELYSGEGNERTLEFKVDPSTDSVISNSGSIGKYGAKFYEAEGELKIKIDLGDVKKEERLEFIKHNFTYPLLKLAKVEQQIVAALSEIDEQFGTLEADINIVE